MRRHVDTIGPSIFIKGEVSATRDLMIDGQVQGTIELGSHVLTIGQRGRVKARVLAKEVNVMGTVGGDISATEEINIHETATVDGALGAPRVGIEEGASFRGQIDIRIPLQAAIRRLKPVKPHVRMLRRLIRHSLAARREANLGRLFGVSPKLAEATVRLLVEDDSRPRQDLPDDGSSRA